MSSSNTQESLALGFAFLDSVPKRLKPLIAHHERLGATLVKYCGECQLAYPDIRCDFSDWVAWMAVRLEQAPASSKPFGRLRVKDLYLAYACSLNAPEAVAYFERDYHASSTALLREIGVAPHDIDDLRQLILTRLLTGRDGRPPKIASYRGTSSLKQWYRIVVVRAGTTHMQNQTRARSAAGKYETEVCEIAALEFAMPPDLANAARQHRQEFRDALQAAIATLPSRERTLLRLEFVEGLHDDQIAKIYRVHRTTALRWRHQALECLAKALRREVQKHFGLQAAEVSSMIRLLRSELSLSLARCLEDGSPDAVSR